MVSVAPAFPRDVSSAREECELSARIERALHAASRTIATGPGCPPRLAEAQLYALFPGGARLRPQLCLVASMACGDGRPALADAAAAAIELLHGASLVHDDLPCFDDADTRRGKAAVHKVFGEPLALLVGDAFIVQSFDLLARAAVTAPREGLELLSVLATAAGTTRGLLAGQAWESEPAAPLDEYHRAKTASLFEASAVMGAVAAGASPHPWRRLGEALGRAYQAADDLNDVVGDAQALGKPTGRDWARGRPSLALSSGVTAARKRVAALVHAALAAVPPCEGQDRVTAWVTRFAARVGVTTTP